MLSNPFTPTTDGTLCFSAGIAERDPSTRRVFFIGDDGGSKMVLTCDALDSMLAFINSFYWFRQCFHFLVG